jgi:elongation factor Ts
VDKDEVPAEKIESERRIYEQQVRESGKPENMIGKIVDGKVEAYYKDVCLLYQPWVREPKKSVGDLVKEVAAKTGENIKVRRFVRYQLGEM